MTREVPLTQGYIALVDDEDYELVTQGPKWSVFMGHSGGLYAIRTIRNPAGLRTTQRMHSLLTGYAQTDHRDGNGLNNTRGNLRCASTKENTRNRSLFSNNKSGFKGVSWHKRIKKWQAGIRVNGKTTHIGYFDDLESAARAYDEVARRVFKEFATLNFPNPDENGVHDIRTTIHQSPPSEEVTTKRVGNNNKSGFKGVSWDNSRKKWKAQIEINYKNKFLGRFSNKEDAARAYDDSARKLFGESARLNFPNPGEKSALD